MLVRSQVPLLPSVEQADARASLRRLLLLILLVLTYIHILQKCGRVSIVLLVGVRVCVAKSFFVKSIKIYETNKIMKKYQNIF